MPALVPKLENVSLTELIASNIKTNIQFELTAAQEVPNSNLHSLFIELCLFKTIFIQHS